MNRVFVSSVSWLSLVGLILLSGCGEDGTTSETSSSNDAGLDVSPDVTSDQDAVEEQECDEKFSIIRFERQHPALENRTTTHNRAISDAEASGDTLGAEIMGGRLTIYLDQRAEADNFRMRVSLEPDMGSLAPGAFCLDDDINPDGICDGNTAVLNSAEYFGPFTTSAGGNVIQGTLTLTTCPSAVGHRAIGTIDELHIEYGVGSDDFVLNTINGSFDVVVFASDGSVTCSDPMQPEEEECQE